MLLVQYGEDATCRGRASREGGPAFTRRAAIVLAEMRLLEQSLPFPLDLTFPPLDEVHG